MQGRSGGQDCRFVNSAKAEVQGRAQTMARAVAPALQARSTYEDSAWSEGCSQVNASEGVQKAGPSAVSYLVSRIYYVIQCRAGHPVIVS